MLKEIIKQLKFEIKKSDKILKNAERLEDNEDVLELGFQQGLEQALSIVESFDNKIYNIIRHSNEGVYVYECYRNKYTADTIVKQYNKKDSYGINWDEEYTEPSIIDDEFCYFELQELTIK